MCYSDGALMSRDRTIGCALVCMLFATACTNKKDVEAAKHSLYDTDFALVYSKALEATRELYPNMDDSPGVGKISTAWHQVTYASNSDDMSGVSSVAANQQGINSTGTNGASPASSAAGMPTRLAYKRYYIRFDVSVIGGRPWRVKVQGHAAEWDPGAALPVEMHGIARPSWLEGRTEGLMVAIYKRIKPYAVPMKEEVKVDPEDAVPKTDPKQFATIPEAAAKAVATLSDTLAKRDYTGLRPLLADDIAWSLGGGTGADAAIAMWQADAQAFEAMSAAIAAGCNGDQRVTCPAGPPVAGKYQLVLGLRGTAWKVTSFVRAE
ncbi:MAG: hypothetical protein JWO36_5177 [Myxococcales bacterium]|nr:hypothetical protein [Myxococcales bacterium]